MQQQTVTLIGHLTAEPFYREFDTGRKFARFRLGTSRRVRRFADNSAHYEERDQLYIDVETWGDLAVNVHESLSKGNPVICVGYLTTQEWRDQEGKLRTKVVLRALYVGFELCAYVVRYCRNPLPVAKHTGGADLSRFNCEPKNITHYAVEVSAMSLHDGKPPALEAASPMPPAPEAPYSEPMPDDPSAEPVSEALVASGASHPSSTVMYP